MQATDIMWNGMVSRYTSAHAYSVQVPGVVSLAYALIYVVYTVSVIFINYDLFFLVIL